MLDQRATEDDDAGAELTDAAPPAALSGYVGFLLRRVFARFAAEGGDGPAASDLMLLEELAGHDVPSQQELAERLCVNRTVMVRLLDRLEEAGYVTRTRNPDNRRTYVLSLTGEGRAALAGMREAVRERNERLTAALSQAERERLKDLLARLTPGLDPSVPRSCQYLVTQAHLAVRRAGDARLAHLGLRIRHLGPLSVIERIGPCPQQALARELAITEPAAAQLVDELARAGLVARGRDSHDRRRYALELTELGRERLAVVREAADGLQADVVAALGEDGTRELRGLLIKLLPAAGR